MFIIIQIIIHDLLSIIHLEFFFVQLNHNAFILMGVNGGKRELLEVFFKKKNLILNWHLFDVTADRF